MYYILVLYTFRFDWRNLRVGAVCADDSQSVLCFLLCRFESCNNILKKKCYIIIYCGIIEQPMLFEVFLNQTDVVWNFNFMLNYIDLDFFLFIAAILFWSPSFVKHFLQSQHIKITIFTKMPENQGYIKIK